MRVRVLGYGIGLYIFAKGPTKDKLKTRPGYLFYNRIPYEFYDDKLKEKLISKLLLIADIDKLEADTVIGDFLVEDINFDVIELIAAKDITKDDEFREKVKGYLTGDMDLGEFHKEVVAYCVGEKLSQ